MACITEGSAFYLGNIVNLRPHVLTYPVCFVSCKTGKFLNTVLLNKSQKNIQVGYL